MSQVKIYHNPRCSKSRQTLDIIIKNGIEPTIIKYLETPPEIEELSAILEMLKKRPRDILRKNETEYKDNNMSDKSLTDEQLISLMHEHPKVIERPIVVSDDKAVIGRPPESVLDIL